jgi:hypothetical protein
MMRLSVMPRPSLAIARPAPVSRVMQPPGSASRFSGAPGWTAAAHSSRAFAGHMYATVQDIRRAATVPLHSACHCAAIRRQPCSPARCAPMHSSTSSARQPPHSQHPGRRCSSCRQATGQGLRQRPSRRCSGSGSAQLRRVAAVSGSGAGQSVDDDEEVGSVE